MKYHVVYSLPGAYIYEGPGEPSDPKFHTFEEARKAALDDLEHWNKEIQANLQELRSAKTIEDLHYTDNSIRTTPS